MILQDFPVTLLFPGILSHIMLVPLRLMIGERYLFLLFQYQKVWIASAVLDSLMSIEATMVYLFPITRTLWMHTSRSLPGKGLASYITDTFVRGCNNMIPKRSLQ